MDKLLSAYDAATDVERQTYPALRLQRDEVERLLRKYERLTGK